MMIKTISFSEILPIWHDHLWPGRETEIKPTNGLRYLGGYDKSIEVYEPIFFGAYYNDELVGVNSGHRTSSYTYRSRGIYVFPKYRGRGISQDLFRDTQYQAISEKCHIMWSMPRMSAIRSYLKFGFKQVSEPFGDMEFGPNCYVVKRLGGCHG